MKFAIHTDAKFEIATDLPRGAPIDRQSEIAKAILDLPKLRDFFEKFHSQAVHCRRRRVFRRKAQTAVASTSIHGRSIRQIKNHFQDSQNFSIKANSGEGVWGKRKFGRESCPNDSCDLMQVGLLHLQMVDGIRDCDQKRKEQSEDRNWSRFSQHYQHSKPESFEKTNEKVPN